MSHYIPDPQVRIALVLLLCFADVPVSLFLVWGIFFLKRKEVFNAYT